MELDREAPLPGSHAVARANSRCSRVYCVTSDFWILCFMFSHPTMSTKHPSVSPISGEKRQKATTLEMKLMIIAQHEGGKP